MGAGEPGDAGRASRRESTSIWSGLVDWLLDNALVSVLLTLFLVGAGLYVAPFDWQLGDLERDPIAADAIPDIGENQQIVMTEWPGRSPRDVEDQVTYPLTTALSGVAGVRTVRSSSAFGLSMVFVIFDDDVDFYWARSRILEKLTSLPNNLLPPDVSPMLGPDATALGQIFWYTLEGRDRDGNLVGGWDPDELRSIQDWTVRYALQSANGVAEVASIGGHVREYQVDVDPHALRAHGVNLEQVAAAVRQANQDVGARTLEVNGVEYVIRSRGLLRSLDDLADAVIVTRDSTPLRIRDVAHVAYGPALRRGALDDAGAPAVGGVVVARHQANPLQTIAAVKQRVEQIQPGLPKRRLEDGTTSQVTIVPFYDRTTLIHETLGTLSTALYQQVLITLIVVLVLLRDLRSSLLITAILPLGVLATFVTMKATGVDANIMALGGIAIAIGTMVDITIVFVENVQKRLASATTAEEARSQVRQGVAEVAPAVVTSVLTTVVSFLPILGLSSSELKLFAPLVFTKTFAMLGALGLAVALVPGGAWWLLRHQSDAGAAPGERRRSSRRRDVRRWQLREWLLLGLGVWLATRSLLPGAFITAFASLRLVRHRLPTRWLRGARFGELTLAVVGVVLALNLDWLPLGPERGWLRNLLFVAGVVAVVLGSFTLFQSAYPRLLRFILRHRAAFLALPLLLVGFGLFAWLGSERLLGWLPQPIRASAPLSSLARAFPGLGREFMPPLDEGSFLYMPTTMPHASIGEASEMLSAMDARIAAIPEVDRVVGKLGRVESAIDPAPLSMFETVITYHPEYRIEADGRRIRQWREHIRGPRDIWNEIVAAAEQPGVTSAPWLMPINARLVMLQSGMRAPMGIKVHGPDLQSIERAALELERVLVEVPAVRSETVFAERVVGKPYLEIELDREAMGRYGLSIGAVQSVLEVALGGIELTRAIEGRERYAVRVRYAREYRDDVEALAEIAVPTASGQHVPLGQLARLNYVQGPEMIRSEDSFLTSYVLFDRVPEVAEVTAVEQARAEIERRLEQGELELPPGVSYAFAGSYENQLRSERRLAILVPLTLGLVFVLLYLQFHRMLVSAIIYSGVLVSVSGAFILLWLYGQPWFLDGSVLGASLRELFQVNTVHLSVAVWVGIIALIGVATDDGVVMATYLQQRFAETRPRTPEEIREQTLLAGMRRVRPCLMTTATTLLALLPVITSRGRGADIMVPIALPMLGGMTIELITLFVVPVLFCAVEERRAARRALAEPGVNQT